MQDMEYIVDFLEKLVNTPSPSGFTKDVMALVEKEAAGWGFSSCYNQKGGLVIEVPGKSPKKAVDEPQRMPGAPQDAVDEPRRTPGEPRDAVGRPQKALGLSAHVDTLGAMVRSISPTGTLRILPVGGFMMESIEGMYCKIHTRTGKTYTGTVLTVEPSVHTHDGARELERKARNMEIRLDEVVSGKEDVEKLEISAGDYVSFDPMFVRTESGFIKSRHLDDKASVAVLMGMLKDIAQSGRALTRTLKLVISNYEETGSGASWIPEDIEEFLAVDMGALGDDLSGDEYKVSICAMDSSGPYDYEMTNRLIEIAKEKNLDYAVDVFPHYGSDVGAAIRGGHDIKGALIGQGVHASHGTERTHIKAMENTLRLIEGFIGLE